MCSNVDVEQVKFTWIDGNAIAQLDPDLRDPTLHTPLCFPLSTMIFTAGIVKSSEKVELK